VTSLSVANVNYVVTRSFIIVFLMIVNDNHKLYKVFHVSSSYIIGKWQRNDVISDE
jgi:hypothetical protein